MFVCPFPTDPKFWKIRIIFFFFYSQYSQFCNCNCPKKGTVTCCNGKQLPLTPWLNQFWGSACPRMHTHMNDTAFLVSRIKKKKKKKKDWPTNPPNFQAKRANTPFIFSGLIKSILLEPTLKPYPVEHHCISYNISNWLIIWHVFMWVTNQNSSS